MKVNVFYYYYYYNSEYTHTRRLTHEHFGGGVVDADGLEDGGAVVGHGHLTVPAAAQQDLVL